MKDMLTVIMQSSKPTCIGDMDVQNSVVAVAIVDESVEPCKMLAVERGEPVYYRRVSAQVIL